MFLFYFLKLQILIHFPVKEGEHFFFLLLRDIARVDKLLKDAAGQLAAFRYCLMQAFHPTTYDDGKSWSARKSFIIFRRVLRYSNLQVVYKFLDVVVEVVGCLVHAVAAENVAHSGEVFDVAEVKHEGFKLRFSSLFAYGNK